MNHVARRVVLLAVLWACAVAQAGSARAVEPPVAAAPDGHSALFALIIGVNASPDPEVAALKYADDDAARYLDLFRALGARTYLLAHLDDNTRRLHPQAAAEAQPARREDLRRAVAGLARDIAQARGRGVRSVLYVIYAGHGDVHDATPYLTLEDGRLDGAALMAEVVNPPGADHTHLIIDACQAYLLAFQRGAGGERRSVHGFVELEAALRQGRIGYLLSSSATGETHEWAGFEAGVFSHEVRSGLYGAADADGDGVVTYDEIAAFVTRANATIVNDRFRPQIVARAPIGSELLLDLRTRSGREMRFDGPESAGHYLLEDAQGVRLLDFHGSGQTAVHLVRPAVVGSMYLRRVADGAERTVPPGDTVVHLEALPVEPSRSGVRGAAQHAFSSIFTLPFDAAAVSSYEREADLRARADAADQRRGARARELRTAEWVAWGVAASSAIVAGAFELSAVSLRKIPVGESQSEAAGRNQDIGNRNVAAAAFHYWAKRATVGASVTPDAGGVSASVTF
jgi:hypothetical protein